MNRYKLQRAINKVKNNNELSFDKVDLESLIKLLSREDYQKYYELRVVKNDISVYECDVYFKFYDGTKTHLFNILFIYGCNDYFIKYNYGVNDSADRLILHWLCDLLTDKYYLKG